MRRLSIWLAGVGVLAGGCQGTELQPVSTHQAIVGGAVNEGDPAIMEVLSFRGNLGARCTATLVTPRVLLLAAHCFVETPGFERFVFPGNNDKNRTDGDLLPVKLFASDPQYTTPRQGHDFGVVVLDAPLPVLPLPMNRAPLDQAQGKNVRYVGYGLTTIGDRNSGGIKRHNTAPLAQVTRLLLSIAPNAHNVCEGDSGGPLLLDDGKGESVIGVGSFVVNPACRRDSFYQRLDTQLAWVDEQIRKYDPGGLAPPGDGGAGDAAPTDRQPDAGTSDVAPPVMADTREPDTLPPSPSPAPDAAAGPVAPLPPGPEPVAPQPPPAGVDGGCSFAGSRAGVGGSAALLFALLCLARRRRR